MVSPLQKMFLTSRDSLDQLKAKQVNNVTFICMTKPPVFSPGVCAGQDVLPPGPVSGAVGGIVMFTTNLHPPDQPYTTIEWIFNSTINVITSTSNSNTTAPGYMNRITLHRSTGSLELRNLALTDNGGYRLRVSTVSGSTLVGDTTLDVYGEYRKYDANFAEHSLQQYVHRRLSSISASSFVSASSDHHLRQSCCHCSICHNHYLHIWQFSLFVYRENI